MRKPTQRFGLTLLIAVTLLAGCSVDVTQTTIVRCKECGVVVSQLTATVNVKKSELSTFATTVDSATGLCESCTPVEVTRPLRSLCIACGTLVSTTDKKFTVKASEVATVPEVFEDKTTLCEDCRVPDYRVVSTEDISFGTTKRYEWNVVVDGQPLRLQLSNVAEEIIEQAKAKSKFNALVVGFYDYPDYVGHGYTLGRVTYAPHGDWGRAMEVAAGDYSKMSRKDELLEKDWTKQLTPSEVRIWAAWDKEYSRREALLTDPFAEVDEDAVCRVIARQFGVTEQRVKDIAYKQAFWPSR